MSSLQKIIFLTGVSCRMRMERNTAATSQDMALLTIMTRSEDLQMNIVESRNVRGE